MFNLTTKVLMAIVTFGLGAFAFGCNTATQPTSNNVNSSSNNTQTMAKSGPIVRDVIDTSSDEYKIEVAANPSEIKAGEQTSLIFTVKDKQGAVVKDLTIVHEKFMHLLVVSKDLSEFDHQHPERQTDGSFKLNYKFANGGTYLLYADFTPQGKHQVVDRFTVPVGGEEKKPVALTEDKEMSKTVDGLSVMIMPDKPLKAGEELMLNFFVKDAQTNQPVTDLQNYLGALAHFVVISEDTTKFLHVHPMEGGETMKSGDMKGGNMPDMKHDNMNGMKHDEMQMGKDGMKGDKPTVSAHTTFPKAGLFKLWAQFQRGSKVIVVSFVVHVAEGEKVANTGKDTAPSDALKVTVSKNGFEPASLTVKKGQAVKLAFYRSDSENCASKVVFPSLNVKKKLPVGQTVLVEIKPEKTGELNFACGMGMMKGKLIVSE